MAIFTIYIRILYLKHNIIHEFQMVKKDIMKQNYSTKHFLIHPNQHSWKTKHLPSHIGKTEIDEYLDRKYYLKLLDIQENKYVNINSHLISYFSSILFIIRYLLNIPYDSSMVPLTHLAHFSFFHIVLSRKNLSKKNFS